MPDNFLQYLIIILIVILFAEKYIPFLLEKFFGFKIGRNGKNGEQKHINKDVEKQIKELGGHAEIANKEMGHLKNDVGIIKNDIKWIRKALDKK